MATELTKKLANEYRMASDELKEAEMYYDGEILTGFRKAKKDAYARYMASENEIVDSITVNLDGLDIVLPIADKMPSNQSKWRVFCNSIKDILDSEIVQMLPISQKVKLFKVILEIEQYEPKSDIMEVDAKLKGSNWACLNADTGITCPNRANGRCKFCEHCYAFKMACKPATAKKQMAKVVFWYENDDLASEIRIRQSPVVRINQEGDFNDVESFLKFVDLAKNTAEVRFYGYTKNHEVLAWIEDNGLPNNLNIQNSLDTWTDNNYIAVPKEKIQEYLDKGYKLCKGKCDKCLQCVFGCNVVTLLRK